MQAIGANMKTLVADCEQGINSGLAGVAVAALQSLVHGTIEPTGVDIGKCYTVMRESLQKTQGQYNTSYDQAAGDALKRLNGDAGTSGSLTRMLNA